MIILQRNFSKRFRFLSNSVQIYCPDERMEQSKRNIDALKGQARPRAESTIRAKVERCKWLKWLPPMV
jgi:hypothetical protein